MPTTKAAKKANKQSAKKQIKNYQVRTKVKTIIKNLLTYVKNKEADKAEKLLPKAYKEIDIATKKGIHHKNTADRRKALLAKSINLIKNTTK